MQSKKDMCHENIKKQKKEITKIKTLLKDPIYVHLYSTFSPEILKIIKGYSSTRVCATCNCYMQKDTICNGSKGHTYFFTTYPHTLNLDINYMFQFFSGSVDFDVWQSSFNLLNNKSVANKKYEIHPRLNAQTCDDFKSTWDILFKACIFHLSLLVTSNSLKICIGDQMLFSMCAKRAHKKKAAN